MKQVDEQTGKVSDIKPGIPATPPPQREYAGPNCYFMPREDQNGYSVLSGGRLYRREVPGESSPIRRAIPKVRGKKARAADKRESRQKGQR